ncbi:MULTISPECIES: histidine phosphatase family protein [Lacticaseibacillus]|uniref:Histidine phosphatase family protein n=1 Tax=Lacticaseibacillus hegangensis TaxID=2486010 RepID=A0ABW4CWW5_9LACO|nr:MULTISPECIES: histidine phosphatase family protein [Lacticaseibacillus]
MTEFYLVRHGQTEINQKGAFNGGLVDSPLTAKGVAGAHAVGAALAGVRFTQVLSSPLPRALTTAQLILAANQFSTHTPLQAVWGLNEMRLGQWDGHTIKHVAAQEALDLYFHRPLEFDADYAAQYQIEPYEAVARRAVPVFETAALAHPTGQILVVGHGLLFQILLTVLSGQPLGRLRTTPMLKNTTVTKLTTANGKHFSVAFRDRQPDASLLEQA